MSIMTKALFICITFLYTSPITVEAICSKGLRATFLSSYTEHDAGEELRKPLKRQCFIPLVSVSLFISPVKFSFIFAALSCRALGQTHSLPSFGLCGGFFARLGNVYGCEGLAYYFNFVFINSVNVTENGNAEP